MEKFCRCYGDIFRWRNCNDVITLFLKVQFRHNQFEKPQLGKARNSGCQSLAMRGNISVGNTVNV